MYKITHYLLFLSAFLCQFTTESIAQVAINDDGSQPSNKAVLDVKSTTKGMHLPRMTSAQRNNLSPTATDAGLMVFDIDKNRLYIFDGQNWLPLAIGNPNELTLTKRIPSDSQANDDAFGYSVAISGDYAIVGIQGADISFIDQGAAYVFIRSGGTWVQQAKITASDAAAGDKFGTSVSISGDYAIVGAPFHTVSTKVNQGAAYIFIRSGTSWTQQAILTNGTANDTFGASVSISGDYAIIGAPNAPILSYGWAFIFNRIGNSWSQQSLLSPSDLIEGDVFGFSVSISGDFAIIGAPRQDIIPSVTKRGAVYIFGRIGTSWLQLTKIPNPEFRYLFGASVSISGNYAIVGCGTTNSSAYIFTGSGTTWTQQAILSPPTTTTQFGQSVCISGDYAIIGEGSTVANESSAYIYKRGGTVWVQTKKLINPVIGISNTTFGGSACITPNACIVGDRGSVNPSTGIRAGAIFFGTIDF
jgi:hypothetical protein